MTKQTQTNRDTLYWNPEEFWKGEEVFVIGGGPSLKGFDWDLIADKKVIGCNDAYRLGAFVDINLFADAGWFRHHREDLRYSSGITVGVVSQPYSALWVNWMHRSQRNADCQPHELPWYGNTGVSGVALALRLGATKVRLLGYDMKVGEGKNETNWHPHNMGFPTPRVYTRFRGQAEAYGKWIKKNRPDVDIVNCNPDSALDTWRKEKLEDVL